MCIRDRIIADTKDHNIAADLCILTGIEVDEDATVAGHFDGEMCIRDRFPAGGGPEHGAALRRAGN